MAVKFIVRAFALGGTLADAEPTCCWSKWGDASTCGSYPGDGHGGLCNADWTTACNGNTDCAKVPPAPSPTPPTPAPPTPTPPVPPTPPTPPAPPTPSPPIPTPAPTPPPGPAPPYSPVSIPAKMLGMYLLVADDAHKPYTSEYEWTPQMFPYQQTGSNTIYLTFINPAKMPAVPPGMAALAQSRGSGNPGAVPVGTAILFAIGGQAYSSGSAWSWLASQSAAEAMAAEVSKWPQKYGCDGIDLDIETGAGSSSAAGVNLAFFVAKLKELAPKMIVTQPVFGSPSQVKAANRMLEAAYNKSKGSAAFGSISKVGIMVYSGTGSETYLTYYIHGCDAHCSKYFCPVAACVPAADMVLGAAGSEGAGTISTLAKDVNSKGLGGIMVWEASLKDPATGDRGLVYGPMDASISKLDAWTNALKTMNQGEALTIAV